MVVSAPFLDIDTPFQQCIMRTYIESPTNWTCGELRHGSARRRTQLGRSRADTIRIGLSGAPKRRISTEPDLQQAGAGQTKSKWDGEEHAAEPHGAGPSWAGAGRTESESERSPQTLRISTEPVLQGLGRSRADQVRGRTEPDSDGADLQALRISTEPDLHQAGAGQTEAAAAAAAATAAAASSSS
jgi:hypothetical protein